MDAIKMIGIVKCFGSVRANDGIDFVVKKQEIHCLLGENGTGKSTLMNILFGLYHPDAGEIYINEEKAVISNPNDAYGKGIGMVHQHFMLVSQLTVLENIILGKEAGNFILNRKESRKNVQELVERFGFRIDLDAKVESLSVGMMQRVEILKTLYRGADIIILDEPTAVLTPQETEAFFKTLRDMRDDGKSIILITHKLEEIISIVDEVTVLRSGRMVGNKPVDEHVTKDELTRMMVGRDVLFHFPAITKAPGGLRLKLEQLSAKNDKGILALKDFSLELREGEIVGLAGVDGNGQKELCEVMTGLRSSTGGQMLLDGEDATNRSPAFYIDKRISHIPEDRHTTGLAMNWSLRKNLILKSIGKPPVTKRHLISEKVVEMIWRRAQSDYQIKASGGEEKARALSGGNQQKVILGKWLAADSEILILDEPTRGIDVNARSEFYALMNDFVEAGGAIIMISSEMPEVIGIANRVIVMREGRISGELTGEDINEQSIISLASITSDAE